jgi:hypothetical protein
VIKGGIERSANPPRHGSNSKERDPYPMCLCVYKITSMNGRWHRGYTFELRRVKNLWLLFSGTAEHGVRRVPLSFKHMQRGVGFSRVGESEAFPHVVWLEARRGAAQTGGKSRGYLRKPEIGECVPPCPWEAPATQGALLCLAARSWRAEWKVSLADTACESPAGTTYHGYASGCLHRYS